jgi:hypothetical protein
MITKELFVSILEDIRQQIVIDEKNAKLVSEAFGCSDFYLYDNSLLLKVIISLLRIYFPKEDNFCEIDHWCFTLNFGKLSSEEDFESAEELYDRLINSKK